MKRNSAVVYVSKSENNSIHTGGSATLVMVTLGSMSTVKDLYLRAEDEASLERNKAKLVSRSQTFRHRALIDFIISNRYAPRDERSGYARLKLSPSLRVKFKVRLMNLQIYMTPPRPPSLPVVRAGRLESADVVLTFPHHHPLTVDSSKDKQLYSS